MGYEYKFVEVPVKKTIKATPGEGFEACKSIITEEAKNGWRLKQVVTPFDEKMGVYMAIGYQIVFEKHIE